MRSNTGKKKVVVTVREKEKKNGNTKENTEAVISEVEILKKVKDDKKKEDLRIGDSSSGHDESDWSWEANDGDWEGTEDKAEREKMKRINRYRKRKILVEKTAKRGNICSALALLKLQSVGYFHQATADYNLAKILAVNEFLSEYLQLTEEDIKDFEVIDTMLSKNDDEIMHVTFAEHAAVKELHKRIADLQNDDIIARRYIPPQFWSRFSHLNKYCQNLREKEEDLKTIIRFNDKDLEVLVKNRRLEEQYRILPLDQIESSGPIPKFDLSIVWKKKS